MQPIIELNNIGKKYKITHDRGRYITLRDVLTNIVRSPFSFLKHKAKKVTGLGKKEEFWALKNINFSVNKGEIVGVIGHNGAGKSTLLKILSQITPPTEGEIIVRGKIGSLLEVGTGFHPELSGRENIFLNAAILGMSRAEMASKFDDIVKFAGIDKFLDTPVKYYSSGMYVRLAFSVAAHLEPDILLVDEVLAVGDAEFQKKCLGKMKEVTHTAGRTILFVSHNMSAIESLCKRSILLEKGQIVAIGNTRDVMDQYLSMRKIQNAITELPDDPKASVSIRKVSLYDDQDSARTELPISKPFSVELEFTCHTPMNGVALSFLFYTNDGDLLLYSSNSDKSGELASFKAGTYRARVHIPLSFFNVGRYSFDVLIHKPNIETLANIKDLSFEIKELNNPRAVVFGKNHIGRIATQLSYSVEKI